MAALSSLDENLRAKLAAEFLGDRSSTLRNSDTAGKFKLHRHPMTQYGPYRRNELKAVLRPAAERKREDG